MQTQQCAYHSLSLHRRHPKSNRNMNVDDKDLTIQKDEGLQLHTLNIQSGEMELYCSELRVCRHWLLIH